MIAWHDEHAPRARAALLVDRDGVVNRKIDGGYVLDYARDFRFIPDFIHCARRFCEAGVPIVVLSNQSCVGRGLMSEQQLRAVMERMIAELRIYGVRLSGYLICPHAPGEGCACRKPAPGLLHGAAAMFGLHLWDCAFIGDSPSDLEAARAAGCPGMLVNATQPARYRDAFKDAFSYICAALAA